MANFKMGAIPTDSSLLLSYKMEAGREIEKALQDVDVNQLTPIQAMLCLSELKEIAQKRGEEEREQLLESFAVKYGKK